MICGTPAAFASKARMNALQNAPQVYDFQWIFDNPNQMQFVKDQFVLEMGDGTSTSAPYKLGPNVPLLAETPALAAVSEPGAEGGFLMSNDSNVWGFYVGRRSGVTTQARRLFGFLGQENPVEVMYGTKGDLKFSGTVSYSNSDKKAAGKQNAFGTRLGVSTDVWEASLIVGLGSNAEIADLNGNGTKTDPLGVGITEAGMKYKGTFGAKLGGSYRAGDTYFYGAVYQDGFKVEGLPANFAPAALGGSPVADAEGNTEIAFTTIEVGAVETVKVDDGQFFYGASYVASNSDNKKVETSDNFKRSKTTLPFLLGMEVKATEWMQLRGSVKQPVLLGSSKTDEADAVTVDNATTIGLGASFTLNKWVLDTTLTGATNGHFDFATNTFANASLSYLF